MAALNNFRRSLHFGRDPSQYEHVPVWCCTGPHHTVQERAVPYRRVCGVRHVSIQLHAFKHGRCHMPSAAKYVANSASRVVSVYIGFRTAGCEKDAGSRKRGRSYECMYRQHCRQQCSRAVCLSCARKAFCGSLPTDWTDPSHLTGLLEFSLGISGTHFEKES